MQPARFVSIFMAIGLSVAASGFVQQAGVQALVPDAFDVLAMQAAVAASLGALTEGGDDANRDGAVDILDLQGMVAQQPAGALPALLASHVALAPAAPLCVASGVPAGHTIVTAADAPRDEAPWHLDAPVPPRMARYMHTLTSHAPPCCG